MSDLISRADAIRVISEEYHNRGGNFDGLDAIRELETLPSKGGDAEILNEDFRPKYMQQCPNNGADPISRADAINAVVNMQDGSGQTYEFVREVMFALKALPSADAVPQSEQYKKGFEDAKRAYEIELARSADAVQGEWVEKDNELVCSVCGNSVSFSRTPKGWVLGRFCQSCGTRMKGGAE